MDASFTRRVVLASLAMAAACGGKVVVDPETTASTESASGAGAAGAAGPASASAVVAVGVGGTNPDGSSGVGVDCGSLEADYEQKLALARQCSPGDPGLQCSGKLTVPDPCNCPVIVNDATPDLAALAEKAFEAWVAAGCGPFECGRDCLPPGTGGFCQPQKDAPAVCAPAFPD